MQAQRREPPLPTLLAAGPCRESSYVPGFRVWSLGSRDLGFRAWGLGFWLSWTSSRREDFEGAVESSWTFTGFLLRNVI